MPTRLYPFYIGSYTTQKSQGIYKYVLLPDGNMENLGLMAKAENPSFLAISKNRKYLLAVNEKAKGYVNSFRIGENQLSLINNSSSGGADPCFVAINKQDYVLVANYTGGNVGLLKIDEQGKLSKLLDIEQHNGSYISERQNEAHAHSAWFVPNNKDIISLDLGTNKVCFSLIDYNNDKLIPHSQANLKMKPGAGPRHLAFHPDNNCLYVLNEINATVTVLSKNIKGDYIIGKSYSTLPSDHQGTNLCAEIQISNDGKFLYASNRGHDSIAVFSISEDYSLSCINYQGMNVNEPRSFALSPDNNFLLVANQNSDTIVSFKRDHNTGLLDYLNKIEAFTPVHILFA